MEFILIPLYKLSDKQITLLLQLQLQYKLTKDYIKQNLQNRHRGEENDVSSNSNSNCSSNSNSSSSSNSLPLIFVIQQETNNYFVFIGLVVIEHNKHIHNNTLNYYLIKEFNTNKELQKKIINKTIQQYRIIHNNNIKLHNKNKHNYNYKHKLKHTQKQTPIYKNILQLSYLYVCLAINNITTISLYLSQGFKFYKSITIHNKLYNIYKINIQNMSKNSNLTSIFKKKSINKLRTITYKSHTQTRTITRTNSKSKSKSNGKSKGKSNGKSKCKSNSRKQLLYKKKQNNILSGWDNQFIISSKTNMAGLDYSTLRDNLNNIGIYETKQQTSKPLFLWSEQLDNNTFDKKYYNTKCFIMNNLSSEKSIITNKYQLYINFRKQYPNQCIQYMALSWNFLTFITNTKHIKTLENNINTNGVNTNGVNKNGVNTNGVNKHVYIVRPVGVGAFSGKDIVIVYNIKTLHQAKKIINKYENIIISEYITNPMLYNLRKFHLRTYFLVSIINGKYKTFFYELYELFTAAKPYNNNDYTDKDVHDTHFKSTPLDIQCPDDLEPSIRDIFNKNIYPKMKNCMLYISKLMENHTTPYPQAKNAFEIFGCDFLVKDNYDVVLMEINDKTGFTMHKLEKKIEFSKHYLNVINELIIQPLFNNNNNNNNNTTTQLKWLYEK